MQAQNTAAAGKPAWMCVLLKKALLCALSGQ